MFDWIHLYLGQDKKKKSSQSWQKLACARLFILENIRCACCFYGKMLFMHSNCTLFVSIIQLWLRLSSDERKNNGNEFKNKSHIYLPFFVQARAISKWVDLIKNTSIPEALRALGHSRHLCTWALEALYLADSIWSERWRDQNDVLPIPL